jgi:hypothetical protein
MKREAEQDLPSLEEEIKISDSNNSSPNKGQISPPDVNNSSANAGDR